MSPSVPANGAPLVSVVVPTYNRADYIAETIESVLHQTYPNFEIIVIDDGSTDDTAKVVERFAPRIRYVWQENSERGASRNHGLRLAQGDYIAFLDSDDLWLPTKLEDGVAWLEANPGVGLLCTDALRIDGNGSATGIMRARGRSGRVTGTLLRNNFVIMATHLARTSAIREVGGFREERQLSGSEDWEMWVRLSLVTDFAYVPEITAKVRSHSENTMSNALAMQRATSRAAELFHASKPLASAHRKNLKRMGSNIALVNAINFCTRGEARKSIRFLGDAVAADPRIILDPRYAYTILRLLKNKLRT